MPSLVLMERAALFVYEESLKLYKTGAVAFCGMGNNGADGIAAARMLLLDGKKTLVVMVGDISKQSLENKTQLEIYTKLGGERLYVSPANMDLDGYDGFSDYDLLRSRFFNS